MVKPLELPGIVLEEVAGAVPLLIERTRSQVELTQRLVAQLPCLARHGAGPDAAAVPAEPVVADPVTADPAAVVAADDTDPAAGPTVAEVAEEPEPTAEADMPAPSVTALAIPDYDSLAASQVVPRLASLSASELADVGTYERAHRSRQTILNRVRQLEAG